MHYDERIQELADDIGGRATEDGIQLDDGKNLPTHVLYDPDKQTAMLASQRPLYALRRGHFTQVEVGTTGEDIGWYYVPSVKRTHIRTLLDRAFSHIGDKAPSFDYESLLRDHLAHNLPTLFPGLSLYNDGSRVGVEYPAEGRCIDILASDQDGGFHVFELKLSLGHERVIGQLLRYMGWVTQHLAKGKPVSGVLMAQTLSRDLVLSLEHLANVSAYEYVVNIKLNKKKS